MLKREKDQIEMWEAIAVLATMCLSATLVMIGLYKVADWLLSLVR